MEQHRLDRLDLFIQEDRIIRHEFVQEVDGREHACLLAALSTEVAAAENAALCPADVMPRWFAELTPSIDDECSFDYWEQCIRHYQQLAHEWEVLTTEDWVELRRSHFRRLVDYIKGKVPYEPRLAEVDAWVERIDHQPLASPPWRGLSEEAAFRVSRLGVYEDQFGPHVIEPYGPSRSARVDAWIRGLFWTMATLIHQRKAVTP